MSIVFHNVLQGLELLVGSEKSYLTHSSMSVFHLQVHNNCVLTPQWSVPGFHNTIDWHLSIHVAEEDSQSERTEEQVHCKTSCWFHVGFMI